MAKFLGVSKGAAREQRNKKEHKTLINSVLCSFLILVSLQKNQKNQQTLHVYENLVQNTVFHLAGMACGLVAHKNHIAFACWSVCQIMSFNC